MQLAIHGHRGFKHDPLYESRRTLHTGADLLTGKQCDRLQLLFVDDAHVEAGRPGGIYHRMIDAYRHEDRRRGRESITDLSAGVPKSLTELITLGRTLKKRPDDVLAYFDRPGTSSGPTEALKGRLEHLRGSALGF